MRNHCSYRTVLTLLATVALASCGATTDPTRFYTLKPSNPADAPRPFNNKNHALAIESVTIPRLLDRPQIVSRIGEHEIKRSEYHQWGGSIVEEIEQLLSKNLELQLSDTHLFLLPRASRMRPDYNLHIKINRLDGELGGDAMVDLAWQLESEQTSNFRNSGSIRHTASLRSNNYNDYVSTLQSLLEEAVASLALQIVEKTTTLNRYIAP